MALSSFFLRKRALATLVAASFTSGCAAVPQLGAAPTIAPPERYEAKRSLAATASGVPAAAEWPGLRWWTAYGDSQLDALIAEGLAGTPDLAAAAARIRQADAQAEEADAARQPTLDASGQVGIAKQSYNYGIPAAFVPRGWLGNAQVNASFGFDVDLWGRNRASYAAARSEAEASRLDYAQTALVLSTSIADAYSTLAQLFAERRVQVDALAIRQQTADLTADRVAAGLDTQAELKQARAAVPTARAELAATDEQIGLTRNRIAALVGKGPDRGLAITPPTVMVQARNLPGDVTTDLVGRRPDIVAARARVEAEASRIKVARADFYPSIRLGALFGFESLGIGKVFNGGSSYGNGAPAISLPIFRGGQLQGAYRGARANYDEAVASYDRSVTDAFHQVADAVTSRRLLATRLTESREALVEARGAYDIARQRYQGGLSRFLDVLSAQDRALQAERAVADLQARAFTLDVALVRALGGGFADAPTPPSLVTQTSKDPTRG